MFSTKYLCVHISHKSKHVLFHMVKAGDATDCQKWQAVSFMVVNL